jgi:phosphate starvation-inducible PhoH-like protein
MEKMTIEIAPLAYMRGRTLDNSFIILDEAQNTTQEQMKMFLTRLGNGSKIVVTGDLTQTDLPDGKKSGLAAAVRILKNIEGIAVHEFSERDVVRHRLVQKIIMAYDRDDRERRQRVSDKRSEERKHFHAARTRKEGQK